MANQEHLDILKQGVDSWNQWRQEHRDIEPDLTGSDLSKLFFDDLFSQGADLRRADVSGANLQEVNLSGAQLTGADLSQADLFRANLSNSDLSVAEISQANLSEACLTKTKLTGANLTKANLSRADLSEAEFITAILFQADLSGADLKWARLVQTNLSEANLSGANLVEADLSGAILSDADLSGADLTGCLIYAISAWNVLLKDTIQRDLIITNPYREEPKVTVDNVEVAQVMYLLLNNKKIRDVIDTIASKVVLILGRFTDERKKVLNALRDELRKRNYSPVLFDFEKPASRDITETVSTLAHMARFVIADITDAKSIPQELNTIVPNLPSVPVQPLILNSQHEYGIFEHFTRFPWVLPIYRYTDQVTLLRSLKESVIDPAERKAQELAKR